MRINSVTTIFYLVNTSLLQWPSTKFSALMCYVDVPCIKNGCYRYTKACRQSYSFKFLPFLSFGSKNLLLIYGVIDLICIFTDCDSFLIKPLQTARAVGERLRNFEDLKLLFTACDSKSCAVMVNRHRCC